MQRMGLDAQEANDLNKLTEIIQMSQSWIQVQANLRSKGVPSKLTKAEAAIAIITATIDTSSSLNEEEILLLLKGISAIFGYQYQENFCTNVEDVFKRPELMEKVQEIITKNETNLELQYTKSLELFNNRGFFEKLMS